MKGQKYLFKDIILFKNDKKSWEKNLQSFEMGTLKKGVFKGFSVQWKLFSYR